MQKILKIEHVKVWHAHDTAVVNSAWQSVYCSVPLGHLNTQEVDNRIIC